MPYNLSDEKPVVFGGYLSCVDSRGRTLGALVLGALALEGPDRDKIYKKLYKALPGGSYSGMRFKCGRELKIDSLCSGLEDELCSQHIPRPFYQQIYFEEPVYAKFTVYPKIKYILIYFSKEKLSR